MSLVTIFLLVLTFLFLLLDGMNDSANLVSTVVSSRTLSPQKAVLLAAAGEFLGACFLGSAVARTMGQEMVFVAGSSSQMGSYVPWAALSAILAATVWGGVSWMSGLPCSSTHALLGGWVGAFAALSGLATVQWDKVCSVFLAILGAPLAGFAISWILIKGIYRLVQGIPVKAGGAVRFLERIWLGILSLAHGANDGQKSMAVLVSGLLLWTPGDNAYFIPVWVRLLCSTAISLGVLLGASNTVRTLGFRLYKVQSIHSFASQSVSGGLLLISTLMGFPLSTGQVVSSSILGVGAGVQPRAIRWEVALEIALNWVITLPVSALLAYFMLKFILLLIKT
ncbi:MAG: inorganic phosphate transporter [Elusimicrobia bacterium]|nr:inorganic phosphate transporter [Elusimicrobiota bacterium]